MQTTSFHPRYSIPGVKPPGGAPNERTLELSYEGILKYYQVVAIFNYRAAAASIVVLKLASAAFFIPMA